MNCPEACSWLSYTWENCRLTITRIINNLRRKGCSMHFQESTPFRASHNSWQDCNLRWGHSISNPPVVYWSWVDKNFFGYRLYPPMPFCFFWHMPTWVAADTGLSPHSFRLEYLQYDAMHDLFSNGIVSQELGWWFQTLHKAARVSPEHMARSRVGHGENMLRGRRKSWFMMFPSYLVNLGHI